MTVAMTRAFWVAATDPETMGYYETTFYFPASNVIWIGGMMLLMLPGVVLWKSERWGRIAAGVFAIPLFFFSGLEFLLDFLNLPFPDPVWRILSLWPMSFALYSLYYSFFGQSSKKTSGGAS